MAFDISSRSQNETFLVHRYPPHKFSLNRNPVYLIPAVGGMHIAFTIT